MEMLRKKEMEKNNKIEYNNKEHKLDYDRIPYEEISNQNFNGKPLYEFMSDIENRLKGVPDNQISIKVDWSRD